MSDSVSRKEDDDSFELYDLRVEVVCPPGERILCGAKSGDHFTLEGEMLHLPPGQGFSIYSLSEFLLTIGLDDDAECNQVLSCHSWRRSSGLRIGRTG